MNLFMSLYLVALFVALTPGVLLTLPKGGGRLTVAVIHALVFAVVYQLTYRMVWRNSVTIDGFDEQDETYNQLSAESQNISEELDEIKSRIDSMDAPEGTTSKEGWSFQSLLKMAASYPC